MTMAGGREMHSPSLHSQGSPAAFSVELVGKYSAFEDIDLGAYLAVRREAVQLMAKEDPYAAILISMHTYNLLSERADRSTIREDELPLLDAFLIEQMSLQTALRDQLIAANELPPTHLERSTLHRHFQLLQACDNLSLLSCVDFDGHATLLHPFATVDGATTEITRAAHRRTHLSAFTLPILATPYLDFVPRKICASGDIRQLGRSSRGAKPR